MSHYLCATLAGLISSWQKELLGVTKSQNILNWSQEDHRVQLLGEFKVFCLCRHRYEFICGPLTSPQSVAGMDVEEVAFTIDFIPFQFILSFKDFIWELQC